MTAAGDEAINQCPGHNNQWCCDGNNVDVQCCKKNNRPFFDLGDSKPFATIGSGSTPSSAPVFATIVGVARADDPTNLGGGQPTSPPSSSAKPSKSSSSDTPSPSRTSSAISTPVTSLLTSISSGTDGPKTIVQTVTADPPSSATSTSTPVASPQPTSHSRLIAGSVIGVTLLLIFLGLALFLIRRHNRKHEKHPSQGPAHPSSPTPTDGTAEFAGGAKLLKPIPSIYKAKAEPGVPELASQPTGPDSSISTVNG